MSRRRQASLLLAVTMLSAGCASAARQASTSAAATDPPSLATSLVTTTGTWAVAVMGGPAAQHNNFWQLFVRPAATGKWQLATPPGVASNGGLVVASLGAGSVVAGFRPSQELSYSPLATSHDNGTGWTPGLLDAALADVPDALAAAPGGAHLLALLASGGAELSGPGGTSWARLATRQTLAASAAGRQCGPASPHRRSVQPSRGSPAGSQLHPPRDSRHLRPHQRDVATGRARAPRDVRTPGHHRPSAHHHGRHHHGAAGGRQRIGGTTADRMVHGRQRPLGFVAAAAPARRETYLGIVRARRRRGGDADGQPRTGHHRSRRRMAATASPATRHGNTRTGTRRRLGRPRRPQHQAQHLAAPARPHRLDRHPDHQCFHPVRVIGLMPAHAPPVPLPGADDAGSASRCTGAPRADRRHRRTNEPSTSRRFHAS